MSITLATWNIQWQFGDWQSRQEPIATTIEELNPDIITLQETWADQVTELAERLGYESTWYGRKPREDSQVGFGNAVLSRWPISKEDSTFLEDAAGRKYRSCVFARVESPFGRVPVFTTHLHFHYDGSAVRTMQLATASEFIEMNGSGDLPPILTGDLNAVPDSDEIRTLTGRRPPFIDGRVWTDAWEIAGDGPGLTWCMSNPAVERSTWPNRRLDYVLVGWPRPKRPGGNPRRAWLFGNEPVDGVMPSDHYGVAVELAVPEPPAETE